jgi:hypothetical protein
MSYKKYFRLDRPFRLASSTPPELDDDDDDHGHDDDDGDNDGDNDDEMTMAIPGNTYNFFDEQDVDIICDWR